MTAAANTRARAAAWAGLSLVLGLALFLLLGVLGPFSFRDAFARLARADARLLALVALSTFVHFWLNAVKWRTVTAGIEELDGFSSGFLAYSGLAGLVGQVLPPQVTVVAVRTLAMRFHGKVALMGGAARSLYDTCYDLLVPFVLLVPSALAAGGVLGRSNALWVSLAALAVTAVAAAVAGHRLAGLLVRLACALPIVGRRIADAEATQAALLTRATTVRLYLLSAARYANMVLRYWLVGLALGLPLPFGMIALATPLVMLAFLASVTPAALGIAEWGWVAVLVLFGAHAAQAGDFAVGARVVTVASVLAVNAVLLPLCALSARGRRRNGN